MGVFGDIFDVVTIVTIVFGLCTSLGLGAKQIVVGMQRLELLDKDLDENGLVASETWTIIIVTCFATLSVISGLNYGIKTLSQTAFILGNFILLTVFFLDEPWYLLNLMVQSAGYHLQHFVEISFYTDAFAQLASGEGKPNDGKGAASAWMDWWTIFYWGWWIAWAPFVGTFLARISRVRTIANVLLFSLTVPAFYALIWFCTFGGAAIRMHRRAEFFAAEGLSKFNNSDHFLHTSPTYRPSNAGKCYDVPATLPGYAEDAYITNTRISPVCTFAYSDDSGYWFDLMNQYYGLGGFLKGLSIIIAGLPFTVILMFMCTALWRALKIDQGDMAPKDSRTDWSLPLYGGIFDMFEIPLTMGRSGMPKISTIKDFFVGLFAPPLLLWKVMR